MERGYHLSWTWEIGVPGTTAEAVLEVEPWSPRTQPVNNDFVILGTSMRQLENKKQDHFGTKQTSGSHYVCIWHGRKHNILALLRCLLSPEIAENGWIFAHANQDIPPPIHIPWRTPIVIASTDVAETSVSGCCWRAPLGSRPRQSSLARINVWPSAPL